MLLERIRRQHKTVGHAEAQRHHAAKIECLPPNQVDVRCIAQRACDRGTRGSERAKGDRRHAARLFTPSRKSRKLNERWTAGPRSSIHPHVAHGVGTASEPAISIPRMESSRSMTKPKTRAFAEAGASPGSTSS